MGCSQLGTGFRGTVRSMSPKALELGAFVFFENHIDVSISLAVHSDLHIQSFCHQLTADGQGTSLAGLRRCGSCSCWADVCTPQSASHSDRTAVSPDFAPGSVAVRFRYSLSRSLFPRLRGQMTAALFLSDSQNDRVMKQVQFRVGLE